VRSEEDLRNDASFDGAAFENLELTGEHLRDREVDGCTFVSCDLREAVLEDCSFVDCELRSSDLSLVRLPRSSFRGVRFVDCRVQGVDWTDAATALGIELTFERCILDGSSFMGMELEGLEIVECRAREVSFAGAVLRGARFPGTDLEGARFQGTDLRDVDFSDAANVVFDPTENRLGGTRLSPEGAVAVLGVSGILVDGPADGPAGLTAPPRPPGR